MKYCERLYDLRQDNDYTQKYVAHYLCIAQNTYSQYESGKRMLPIDHLLALCDLYHTSADYLLGRTEKESQTIV